MDADTGQAYLHFKCWKMCFLLHNCEKPGLSVAPEQFMIAIDSPKDIGGEGVRR